MNENVGKCGKGNNYGVAGTLREPSHISPIVSAASVGDHESGLIKFNGTEKGAMNYTQLSSLKRV
jgi:nucleoside phosphorylase